MGFRVFRGGNAQDDHRPHTTLAERDLVSAQDGLHNISDAEGRGPAKRFQLFDGGTQLLDFTWVEDTVEGFYLASTHAAAANETFNITSGTARTLRDLADIARNHFPDLKVVSRQSRDPVRRTKRGALDVSKARRMLGYEPRTMLDAGFARYVDFCREHEAVAR